ncbi:MAG: hypothetical protein O3C27_03800 [Actinomycetota bacterium]|nr:hypothetical protein [Actinomycetota bacterium]
MAERLNVRNLTGSAPRFAIVHDTGGPKLVLGVLWAATLLGAAAVGVGVLSAVVLVPVGALAGLQVANAWASVEFTDRCGASLAGAALAMSGTLGVAALGAGVLAVTVALFIYSLVVPIPRQSTRIRTSELLILSSMPAGLAAGSLVALAVEWPQAFVSLVVLVSAYETGDFLVGSGETGRGSSQIAGMVAGLSALVLVATTLFFLLPYPFTTDNLPGYALAAAAGAPFGQACASALLPATSLGASPALLRLDSYLLVAPVWLIVL